MAVVHTVTNQQIQKNAALLTQQVNWLELPVAIFTLLNTKSWSVLEAIRENVSHRQHLVLSHHEYGRVHLCRINVFDLILV
jgi:hypothetical protein